MGRAACGRRSLFAEMPANRAECLVLDARAATWDDAAGSVQAPKAVFLGHRCVRAAMQEQWCYGGPRSPESDAGISILPRCSLPAAAAVAPTRRAEKEAGRPW